MARQRHPGRSALRGWLDPGFRWRSLGAARYRHSMKRIVLAALFALATTAGQAQQSFVTVKPGAKTEAWWLRAEFNPMRRDVRGIPVGKIRRNWCRATEYARELFPHDLLVENGTDLMAYSHQSFSLTGNFDRSKTKQVALVGVYQTCGGEKGSFLLIIDEGTQKVRFVDTVPSKTQYAALALAPGGMIVLFHCMECHDAGKLRWNRGKKAFTWVR
jgi:hypothetical protein